MIEVEVGIEVRRYCTTHIRVDQIKDVDAVVAKMVRNGDESLDWNEPEIDYTEILGEYPDVENLSPIYDIAYEEQQDAKLFQRYAG